MILWLVTSCGADLNLRRGEKYLALGEYYDAANEFRQAYQKTPAKERAKRGQIARKMAMCYDKSLQSARALAAWRNAIRYQQADTADRLAFAQTLMKMAITGKQKSSFSSCWTHCPTTSWRVTDSLQPARLLTSNSWVVAIRSSAWRCSTPAGPTTVPCFWRRV